MNKVCVLGLPFAGTEFFEELGKIHKNVCPYRNLKEYVFLQDTLYYYDLFGGKIDYRVNYLLDDVDYYLWVCEPINRTLLHIASFRDGPEWSNYKIAGIIQFLKEPELKRYLHNYQVKMLTREVSNLNDEERLSLALQRLGDFKFIGIQEHYKISLALYNKTFGTNLAGDAKATLLSLKQNEEVLNEVQKCNELDLELYKAAIQRFKTNVAKEKKSS